MSGKEKSGRSRSTYNKALFFAEGPAGSLSFAPGTGGGAENNMIPAWGTFCGEEKGQEVKLMMKTIGIQESTLHFPVKAGAETVWVQCSVDGRLIREFEIEWAQDEPDFWAPMDVSPFLGKQMVITAENSKIKLDNIRQGRGAEAPDLYRERLRPQFHFSAKRGWINDPNGLVYYRGKYLLFYQHNPFGTKWGNMHWGHAVSGDLVHWTDCGDVLYPDELGTVFSGSGLVDTQNALGLKKMEEDPIVLFYTAAGETSRQSKGRPFTQCIAYSDDGGHTFKKYEGNPVIGHIRGANRDPKVIWHEETKQWIMALYLEREDYCLLTSRDLKNWELIQYYQIPGTGECPDLFELCVDGDPDKKKWVLWSANGSYLIGDFDGHRFVEEDRVITGQTIQSGCSYAAQTWFNAPDGRRIQIAWATIQLPGMPFNGCMTFPCELTLRTRGEGIRLYKNPVREIEKLYTGRFSWEPALLSADRAVGFDFNEELYDLSCEIKLRNSKRIEINLNGLQLHINVPEETMACGGQRTILRPENGKIRLRVLMDRAVAEVFANDGAFHMPVPFIDPERTNTIDFLSRGGDAELGSLTISTIKSIWNKER